MKQGEISKGDYMVEFEFQRWKKIGVHEVIRLQLEEFLTQGSMGVQAGGIGRPLFWVDSVIFKHAVFPDTDDVIREKMKGVVHWSSLTYTPLEKVQPEFKVAGNIRIPVIDVSSNELFREMAGWIRETFKKK